jgi:hypothetical protein
MITKLEQRTYTCREALAKKELPIFATLSNKESQDDQCCAREEGRDPEVANIKKSANKDARGKRQSVLC